MVTKKLNQYTIQKSVAAASTPPAPAAAATTMKNCYLAMDRRGRPRVDGCKVGSKQSSTLFLPHYLNPEELKNLFNGEFN